LIAGVSGEILAAQLMTSLAFGAVITLLVVGVLVYAVRRLSLSRHDTRMFDLGAVSTRWLSELRRDEPWTRS
jgi:type IV secretory pathway VirB3-like protein